MHAYSPSTLEVKAGASIFKVILGCVVSLKPTWPTETLAERKDEKGEEGEEKKVGKERGLRGNYSRKDIFFQKRERAHVSCLF